MILVKIICLYYIGLADCVLALGFEKMQRGSLSSQVKNISHSFFLFYKFNFKSFPIVQIQWINILKQCLKNMTFQHHQLLLNFLAMLGRDYMKKYSKSFKNEKQKTNIIFFFS